MKRIFIAVLIVLLCISNLSLATEQAEKVFQHEKLPALPGSINLSGAFSGVSNEALIVAGGVIQPQQVYTDRIFVLEPGTDKWNSSFKLDQQLAFGTSVTTESGLLCIGGKNADGLSKNVFLLEWADGQIKKKDLLDLPLPLSGACGGIIENNVYIVGKSEDNLSNTLLKLELPSDAAVADWDNLKWQQLEPCPGPALTDAASAVLGGKLYVFGGSAYQNQTDQSLAESYCYTPGTGWTNIAQSPQPITGAAAINYGDSHIFVFGGSDEQAQPSKDILAYHTITDTWLKIAEMPTGLTQANAVSWDDKITIAGPADGGYKFELLSKKRAFGILNTSALILYFVAVLIMGFYFSKREKGTKDFFLGGKRVPWWVAGLSIHLTGLSSITFMGAPAKVYATNWVYFMGIITIVLVQPIIIYCFLPFFRRLDVTSAYEYLEKRFGIVLRLFGSASFILFQCGRITIVMFLPALALSAVTGLNIYLCIITMGVISTVYTVMGGIEAVVWTDVMQAFVLWGSAILALIIIIFSVDGGVSQIFSMGQAVNKFTIVDFSWDYAAPVFWVIIVGGLFQSLVQNTTDQSMVQRLLITKNERDAAKGLWLCAAVTIPVSLLWFLLGTCLYAFYKMNPASLDPTLKTDQIFPLFISQQLPDGVVGLVIAGLFAAAMSTVDSGLNSISTAFVTDFYRRFKPSAPDKTCLTMARWVTVVLGLIATCLGLWMAVYQQSLKSLWDVFMAILGLLMGGLGGLFILGIFTRRTNATGALVGAIASSIVLYLVQHYTRMHFYMFAAVGVLSCCVVGYIVSLMLPKSGKSTEGLTIYSLGPRID